jgi:hypothetical protein
MPSIPYGPNNPHPLSQLKTELGKASTTSTATRVGELHAAIPGVQ